MLTFMLIYGGIALAIGLAVPFGLFLGYRIVGSRSEQFPVAMFIWLIAVGSALTIATSSRNWNATGLMEGYYSSSGLSVWLSRAFNLGTVAFAVIEIIRRFVTRTHYQSARGPTAIWVAFILFFLSWLLSAFVGTKPQFQHSALYSVLLLSAVYLQPSTDVRTVVEHSKWAIVVTLLLSVIMAAIRPDLVVETGYRSVIPGVHFRLHGLATHANGLGPLALIYLLLEYWYPSKKLWRIANATMAAVVLVLAQSKTAWIAGLGAAGVLQFYHLMGRLRAQGRGRSTKEAIVLAASPFLIAPAGALALLMAGPSLQRIWMKLETKVPAITTLTGRDVIWEISLAQWRANPLFGYGPSLWDIEFRISHGLLAVGQAHNQFVQTLGESGTVGLIGLLGYLGVLTYLSITMASRSNGVTVALVLVLMLRCITEAPFRMVTFLDPAFLTHLTVFAVLVTLYRQERHAPGSNGDGGADTSTSLVGKL